MDTTDAIKIFLETKILQDESKKLRREIEDLKETYDEIEERLKRLAKEISLMEPIKKEEE